MIISIASSFESFKTVEFHEGLNVLLSDRHPNASERQTRNSAGKTVNAGVNWGHGAGVRRDHLLMPDTVLPVVPGVHWRDPRCFV